MSANDQTNFSDMSGISQSGGSAGAAGIDPGMAGTAGAATGGAASGGSPTTGGSAGSDSGGSSGSSGSSGSAGDGGVTNGGSGGTDQAGTANGGSGGTGVCEPSGPERCDGLDNNCEDGIEDEECPENCTGIALGNHGYMFCGDDPETFDNHSDAMDFCDDLNLNLVSIETLAENDLLVQAAIEAGLQGEVWIGANDMMPEGAWELANGTPFWNGDADGQPVGDFEAPWAEGEPDDGGFGDEDCAVVDLETGLWNDQSCIAMTNYDFICDSEPESGFP